jgi:hypothetical protein
MRQCCESGMNGSWDQKEIRPSATGRTSHRITALCFKNYLEKVLKIAIDFPAIGNLATIVQLPSNHANANYS